MPTLELTTAERALLREVLETQLSDLRMEISDTDLKSYRDKLKEKEGVIKGLLQRLGSE